MMDGQTSDNTWTWFEIIGDYKVWRRPIVGGYVYQVTRIGDPSPTNYAGYANKNALLRMKGLI